MHRLLKLNTTARFLVVSLLLLPLCVSLSPASTVTHLVTTVRTLALRGQTQPISQSNLFTTTLPNATYRVNWYLVVTSTTATMGTISGQLQYTDDDLGAESVPFINNVSASTVGASSGSFVFRQVKGTVTFNTNFDSNVNGTPSYNLHLTVERIGP
jgi:hypothetical protein